MGVNLNPYKVDKNVKEKDKKNSFNLFSNLLLLHNLKNNRVEQCGLDAACPIFTYIFLYMSVTYFEHRNTVMQQPD